MYPPLLSLPRELLVEVFSHLRPRDIAACRRSCSQLNDTVTHSQLLQYLIRVGRSGLHDPLLPGYTIPQRIEALEKWQASWRDLETKSTHHVKDVVTCPVAWRNCTSYQIHDDFLIGTCSFDNPGYGYIDLRAFQSEGGKDPWTRIANDTWRGKRSLFTFSTEQDLVLAALSPLLRSTSMFIELHGIRFTRGTPHPYVISATIPIKIPEDIDVLIVGDRTILNASTGVSHRIFLHYWKDGRVCLLREAPKRVLSLNLTVLSRDTIALVETDGAALELCRIVEGLDSRTPSLCTIVRLGFPPFAIGVSIRHSYWSQEVVPAYVDAPPLVIEGRPPRRIPFHHSPEEVLVAMVISDENIVLPTFVALVTRLRTLVALATTTPPGVTFIPWENWGPRATACFELPLDLHSRVDAITGVRCTRIREGELSILDFNSMRIRDAMQRNRNSSGRPADVTTVGLRSIIARGRHFREDVVSELPYICFNVSASPLDWNRIVIYEEGLARLSSNVREQMFYVQVFATE